ncbi:hypothetical protein F8271_22555 [Micromonospora sp. ALFpr18c]|uniref:hypothetical protein n=1 Tax=unclassified Micromonospora TaxID=2617518 RepID=UPI00124B43C8|nr:hypothetical protein [Micromonospora sp. ALFpr18c]KAB1934778.1 hypothetical protein F8271_22555 [Micromonospora sp. ALFpr18c]
MALALTLGCAVTVLAGHLAIRRGEGPRWWGFAGGLSMLIAAIVLAAVWGRDDDGLTFMALTAVTLPLGVLTAAALLVRARYQGGSSSWIGWALTGLLLTALLSGLPLAGWLVGNPPQTRAAVALALLVTVPGVLLAIRIARLVDPARAFERRYRPRPPYPPYPNAPYAYPPYPHPPHPPRPPAVPDPPYPSRLPPR